MSESDWREMVNDGAMPAAFQQHAELPADDGCGCHEYWYGELSEDACGCPCHDPAGFIRPDDRELSAAELREFRARWAYRLDKAVLPEPEPAGICDPA